MEPEVDLRLKCRHRDIILTSGFVALIYFVISGIVGWGIGRNGAEMSRLLTDSGRVAAIAHRISEARGAAERTVQSHIAMYEKLEPDVQEFESALGRLRTDWTVYDPKFPQDHGQTAKRIAEVDIEFRRAVLLKEQIAVAKTIKSLEERQQWTAWESQMQPLLDKEVVLDNPK